MTVWKSGCNWGKGRPSFYSLVKERHIALGYDDNRVYKPDDLLLIAEGFNVKAIGIVKTEKQRLDQNLDLARAFTEFEVTLDEKVMYFEVDFYELSESFEYQLQRGIGQVRDKEILAKVKSLYPDFSELLDNDEKRLVRLTNNLNNWVKPSGHLWRKRNQGKANVAFENQYGFGYEEWLLNPRFNVDGVQYGYIEGVNRLPNDTDTITELFLYTITSQNKRLLVGKLINVQKIKEHVDLDPEVRTLYENNASQMIEELRAVKADEREFIRSTLRPNLSFLLEDADFFDIPIILNDELSRRLKRFIPIKIEGKVQDLLSQQISENFELIRQEGRRNNSVSYERNYSAQKTTITPLHNLISDYLYEFLSREEGVLFISQDKSRINNCPIDMLLETKDGYDFFEIKTSSVALSNIRQGLGQLLEYSFLDPTLKINKLVIVGHVALNSIENEYFHRLKSVIGVRLEYWAYNAVSGNFTVN